MRKAPDNEDVMGHCDPGLKDTKALKVRRTDTAVALGSGDVPVLGTPALLALAESACVDAISGDLPSGQTSVGVWAEVEHERATAVGGKVVAEATLTGHHGRRLEFNVLVREGDEIVAKVRHRRVLVDRERFLEKVGVSANGQKAAARN
ncbi:MAG TPA: hotdog domain-containing protein [Nitriliruptorales bacterium]